MLIGDKRECNAVFSSSGCSSDTMRVALDTARQTKVEHCADIDEIDTTNGVSSEDTDANINAGAAVANGKVIYIGFDADPEGTCVQMIFEMWYHSEED